MGEKRANIILNYIRGNREVTLRELCSLFPDYNEMTIRRDLNLLEKNGYIVRTHGGAKLIEDALPVSHIYDTRAESHIQEKKRIAVRALSYINGHTLYLDASTTVFELAKILPDEPMFVVTNSPAIAIELRYSSQIEVLLTGGSLNKDLLSVSGPAALHTLSGINIDTAVMGASGISSKKGCMNRVYAECELKKQAIANANNVIMLADSSKFGKIYPYTFADFTDIDMIISEKDLPDEIRNVFMESRQKLK